MPAAPFAAGYSATLPPGLNLGRSSKRPCTGAARSVEPGTGQSASDGSLRAVNSLMYLGCTPGGRVLDSAYCCLYNA